MHTHTYVHSHRLRRYLQKEGFYHIHTPILTPCDCEGAGEMFAVTTERKGREGKKEGEGREEGKEFFGVPAYLTVWMLSSLSILLSLSLLNLFFCLFI